MKIESSHPMAQLAKRAFPSYRGRKFRLETMKRPRRLASYWDGGSRDTFRAYRVEQKTFFTPPTVYPFGGDNNPDFVPESGVILIEHSVFCGKDVGCTIYTYEEDEQHAI